MPHSTRSQPSSNNTMSRPSTDAFTIEVDPERQRLIGLTTNQPLTNGHFTNGYHSDESNTADEVQMRSRAHSAAIGSSIEPSIPITATGAGAGAGAVTTPTQTYISETTINGTNITGTTITGTRISGITINGTNVNQTTIHGVPTSSATANGSNNNINGTTPIERAPPPFDEHEAEAEAAFAATVASVITSNANDGRTAITVNERTGSISLDTGVTKVYPRALFDINPTKLGDLLRREFGDPWVRDPPVWVIEVLHDGSFKVTAPRALTDGEVRSCEGF